MTAKRLLPSDRRTRQSSPATTPRAYIDRAIHDVLTSLPDPLRLSPEDRRGIIARYTAVLEGNFIYWTTAAYLSVVSQEAHTIIEDNLREEVRDNHPGMLRKFAMAAHAIPTDSDLLAIHRSLQDVRMLVTRLGGVQMVLMIAFFEGFIQEFMPYLADLARMQGSAEQEYTDVHGVCDIVHKHELFRAFAAETTLSHDPAPLTMLLEGVEVLRTLIETIIHHNHHSAGSPH